MRLQVAADVEAAARCAERHGDAAECATLQALLLPLGRTMPEKALKHVQQVVSAAVIQRKRVLSKAAGACGHLLVLPDETLLQVCAHLSPLDLASLMCS